MNVQKRTKLNIESLQRELGDEFVVTGWQHNGYYLPDVVTVKHLKGGRLGLFRVEPEILAIVGITDALASEIREFFKAAGRSTMAERYPKYYKDVRHLDYIDAYRIHQLYEIDDPSGCLQHANKKILLSGERAGGKAKRKDIEEARDTLTRWLEIQDEDERL